MFCSFCGNVLPDNARFCGKCGANVERPMQQGQPQLNNQPAQAAQPVQPSQPVSQAQNLYGQPAQMSQPMTQAQAPYGQPMSQPYGQSMSQPYGQPMPQPQAPYGQPAYQQQNPYGQPAQGYNNQSRMTRKQFYNTYLTKKTKSATKALPILFIVSGVGMFIITILLMILVDSTVAINLLGAAIYLGSGLAMLLTKKPVLFIVLPIVMLVWVIFAFITSAATDSLRSSNLFAILWPILAIVEYKPNKRAYDAYQQYVATGAVPSQLI